MGNAPPATIHYVQFDVSEKIDLIGWMNSYFLISAHLLVSKC
jgi:hypothetical protein